MKDMSAYRLHDSHPWLAREADESDAALWTFGNGWFGRREGGGGPRSKESVHQGEAGEVMIIANFFWKKSIADRVGKLGDCNAKLP